MRTVLNFIKKHSIQMLHGDLGVSVFVFSKRSLLVV